MSTSLRYAGLSVLAVLLAVILIVAFLVDPAAEKRAEFAAVSVLYSLDPNSDHLKPGDVDTGTVDDKVVVVAKGPKQLVSTTNYKIDPTKQYKLTARLRVTTDDATVGGARTFVGVATYGEDGRLITTGVGTHRYAAMLNRLVKSSEGWVEAEGILSGMGDDRHDQFRPGTEVVRPVLLLNYRSDVAVTELEDIRFEEVVP